ncbi:hypothetical protein CAOG_04432 [Capsaspora owczarzaki ATCC 30864]|uniref:hypothetical protein n=1 Tax=Capsaspora owczarzaki (strain ATCC 30864) TaxID=595528 RepID=UPI0001FE26C5|nr:hypothetical protein CAOG_04432 [Capsaspora owczarzaki ATCC 30864]|eukprot:XP_004348260.1 hypothetical protein CAOG_04432 [Capsaspora owczarzaki ATCC 30864]
MAVNRAGALLLDAVQESDIARVRKHLSEPGAAALVRTVQDATGASVLHLAAGLGSIEIVYELLRRGAAASMNTAHPTTQAIPLHLAAAADHGLCVELLLRSKCASASLAMRDANRLTPLEAAVRAKATHAAAIIERLAATCICSGSGGGPGLGAGAGAGAADGFFALANPPAAVSVSTAPTSSSSSSSSSSGTTLFSRKKSAGNLFASKSPSSSAGLPSSSSSGSNNLPPPPPGAANAGAQQLDSDALLTDVTKSGSHTLLMVLLNCDESPNVCDPAGRSLVWWAASAAHPPCLALLLERGADVHRADTERWTALHAAAMGGSQEHAECVDMLLAAGANAWAETNNRETCMDLARRCGKNKTTLAQLEAARVAEAVAELSAKLNDATNASASGSSTAINNCDPKVLQSVRTVLARLAFLESQTTEQQDTIKRLRSANDLPAPRHERPMSTASSDGSLEGYQLQLQPPSHHMQPPSSPSKSTKRIVTVSLSDETERVKTLTSERDALAGRCKTLMMALASAAVEHDEAVAALRAELEATKQAASEAVKDKDAAIRSIQPECDAAVQRCENAFSNRIARVSQDTVDALRRLMQDLEEADEEKRDLMTLHASKKLTWVPDEVPRWNEF